MITASLLSDDMARVCFNALAFSPARSTVKTARVQVRPDGFTVTATDGFAIGQDWCGLDSYEGPPNGLTLHVDRTALSDLDSGGRKDKRGYGRVEIRPGDGLVFKPANNDVPTTARDLSKEANGPLWGMVDDLLTRMERKAPALPELIAFDPQLLAYFAKVKVPKVKTSDMNLDRAMDLCIFDAREPVLVKIGRTFRGAIMPINRDVHRENVEQFDGGLW
ncbi:hypothetical protein ACFCZT_07680 [Streptomyces sp. NPDC056230]|uniref:hypothetical protein n=1 Tax=Streptomyces sp. NPDC056230 TaxID=3345754 RepID=UPI0035E28663